MKDEYGEQNGEYGKQPEEYFRQPPEIVEYPETQTYAEAQEIPDESKEYSEDFQISSGLKAKAKRNESKLGRVIKTVSALVATVAAVVIIAPGVMSDTTTVEFQDMVIRDTYVKYSIVFDEWSGKDYDVVLYNDFTERTMTVGKDDFETRVDEETGETVVETTFSNKEKNLKSGMTYTLAVKSGYKTIAKTSFRTLREEEMPVTAFDMEDGDQFFHGCACEYDGTFHFKIEVVDENGWWTDFKATLTDSDGTVSESEVFATADGTQHTIPVTDVLIGTTATLRITCNSYEAVEDGGEVEEVVLVDDIQVEI